MGLFSCSPLTSPHPPKPQGSVLDFEYRHHLQCCQCERMLPHSSGAPKGLLIPPAFLVCLGVKPLSKKRSGTQHPSTRGTSPTKGCRIRGIKQL